MHVSMQYEPIRATRLLGPGIHPRLLVSKLATRSWTITLDGQNVAQDSRSQLGQTSLFEINHFAVWLSIISRRPRSDELDR